MIRILFAAAQLPQFSLSHRHTKGISTLFLLILAESLSLSNAVNFWSIYDSYHYREGAEAFSTGKNQKPNQFARTYRKVEECLEPSMTATSSSSGSNPNCSLPPSLPPARLFPRTRLALRVLPNFVKKSPPEECHVECAKCINPPDVAQTINCNIPRGGHSIVAPAPLADATAAAANFPEVAPYGIPLTGWKVIFQIILTAINVVCWLVPLRSKKISENKFALSLANAFSGGVFLSLAFGHLIPECIHGFEGFNEVTPYMLVLAGYLLIFFFEKVAFDAHDLLHEMEHSYANMNGAGNNNNDQSTDDAKTAVPHSTGRSAQILLGALAIHSILEMMALGLADSFRDCALLTMSIALHQPAESIALLVAFLKTGMPKPQIIQFLSVFSAMGPIGVALGIAVNEFAAPIVDAIMLAIVAGTFVYVGATEVIPEEFEDAEHKWIKFFALISGIVSIFLITQYTMSLGA